MGNTHPSGGSCKDEGPLAVLRTPVSRHSFLASRILSLQRPLLVLALLKVSIWRGGATDRFPFVECLVFGWNLVRTCSSSFLNQRDVSGLCTYGVRWTSSTSDHPAAVTWSAQTVEQSNVPPPPPTNLSTCFLHQFVYSEVHVRKKHLQDRVEPGTKLIVKTCTWKTVSASVF